MKHFQSDISHKDFPISEKVSANSISQNLLEFIRKENPNFNTQHYLALSELTHYREKYIAYYLKKEVGKLTELENTVLNSLRDKTILTDNIDDEDNQKISFGQHLADKVAEFGGSWRFIISFGVFILLWILLNIIWFQNKGYDPYPFILLNLILSCLASLQAPIIMMSQNRQEEKDRERGKKDYMVNLKAELEIRVLHEKIDHLIINQQQELLEIQKVQIELLNDILKRVESK
jgi:uncharacterized membrane protein